ncbi:MAG: glycosyltransferase 87 family protein [Terracidiphilus sp.]
MSAQSEQGVVGWLERGVLLLAIVFFCVHSLPRAWRSLNTDFPNYYLSARLAHEGFDTARMYEWTWLQREKDHRAIDIRIIGLLPITPFSTLVMWPLAALRPLTAKHIWILTNLVLLVPLCWIVRSMTGLTWQRIALVFALSFPLHRNLLYGQFYIVLLVLIAGACWAYLRGHHALAGVLVAIATACKLFPALFFIFFLRRRAWRALASGAITGAGCAAASVAVFGWNVHRTYLREILPWALRGEGLPPYATASASISSVLHYLFLAEPQWNPHPWRNSPLIYALLLPTIQMAALAPAILLIRLGDRSESRILLEWSALLVAALAVSTIPASYNFVLLAFPVCVLTAILLRRKKYSWLVLLLITYLGIGLPMPASHEYEGPRILLYVPRLFLSLALLIGIYAMLWRDGVVKKPRSEWSQFAWATVMVGLVAYSVVSTFRLERAVRQEYAYRLPSTSQDFLEVNARSAKGGLRFIQFSARGYRLVPVDLNSAPVDPPSDDELSFASGSGEIWVEQASRVGSQIVEAQHQAPIVIADAREPLLSSDGQSLAFIRDDHGRGRLMMRTGFAANNGAESALTAPSLDVYEASFLSATEFAFSAVEGGRPPEIYLTDATHDNALMALGESRYPALSPDRHWLAYSRFEDGAWNLWLRDQLTGATHRIADLPCNQIEPAWEGDSKTVVYSTDCGRSLWFAAVARRRPIP